MMRRRIVRASVLLAFLLPALGGCQAYQDARAMVDGMSQGESTAFARSMEHGVPSVAIKASIDDAEAFLRSALLELEAVQGREYLMLLPPPEVLVTVEDGGVASDDVEAWIREMYNRLAFDPQLRGSYFFKDMANAGDGSGLYVADVGDDTLQAGVREDGRYAPEDVVMISFRVTEQRDLAARPRTITFTATPQVLSAADPGEILASAAFRRQLRYDQWLVMAWLGIPGTWAPAT